MRYTTDPGADTSAQDYLADQGDNQDGAAKELTKILIKAVSDYHLEVQRTAAGYDSGLPHNDIIDKALAQLQLYIEQSNRDGRISELKQLEPPEQHEEYAKLSGYEYCPICGFNAVKFRKHIQDRLKELRNAAKD